VDCIDPYDRGEKDLRNLRLAVFAALGLIAIALAVAACGGGDSSTTAETTSETSEPTASEPSETSGEGSEAGGIVAESEAIIEEAESGSGEFPKPTEAFDPGHKKAAVIDYGFDIPVINEVGKITVGIWKEMGWDVASPYDGELNPATYGALIDKLTEEGVNAITFISVPLEPVKASVERAIKAGVALTDVNGGIATEITDLGVVDATVNFEKEGELQGHFIIGTTNGEGNAVLTLAPESPPVVERVHGAENVLKTCSTCKFQILKMTAAETTEPGPPTWTGFLSKNPEGSGITNVVGFYDGITLPMATTLAQQGREDISMQGYDADEAVIEMIRNDTGPVVADVAIPYEYEAWSAVDIAARIVNGLEPWEANDMPFQLITKQNAAAYKPWFEPEGDWKGMFKKMWEGK
jgi:inositol transport system substrate-binding protein